MLVRIRRHYSVLGLVSLTAMAALFISFIDIFSQ